MNSNDPFFDAWVRQTLRDAEVRPPERVWDGIRAAMLRYFIPDRNKYGVLVLLVMLAAGGVGYWAFHPVSSTGTRAYAPKINAPVSLRLRSNEPLAIQAPVAIATPLPVPEAIEMPVDMPADMPVEMPADMPVEMPGSLKAVANGPFSQNKFPEATAVQAGLLPVTVIENKKPKAHTYIDIYTGPDHDTHYFKASSEAYEAYIKKSNAVEQAYLSFSLGFKVDMPLVGDVWRFEWGLHYSQINEKLHNIANQQAEQSLNAYRRVDVPLLISRTLVHNASLQVSGYAGALINLTSWYNGDILDTNYKLAVVHTGKTSTGPVAWKSDIGTSLYGGLGVYDQLTNRLQGGVEPYLRYQLSTVNKDVSIYKERYVTTGLLFHLRYDLHR